MTDLIPLSGVSKVELLFDDQGLLTFTIHHSGEPCVFHAQYTDTASMDSLIDTLKKKFGTLRLETLVIRTDCMVVDGALVDRLVRRVVPRFPSFDLQFRGCYQESVMEFVLNLGRRVDSLQLTNCSADPLVVARLPMMKSLSVVQSQAFGDQHVLAVARNGHSFTSLPVDLSDPSTIPALAEIVRSNEHTQEFKLDITAEHLHRFLASINLREEGTQLLDVTEPQSPIPCGEIDMDWPV
ncbi:hypothetical protein PFISCL1PPCAC_23157, partial [Pristionchus fissidentatus]